MSAVILCRFGELFLKSGNRRRFERTLHDNVRAAVADVPGALVQTPHGRILVEVPDEHREEACARLQRVFGLVSLSPAAVVAADLDAIGEAAVATARGEAQRRPAPPTFKIVCRRSDKRFPLPSPEVAARVGGRVIQALGLKVDVHEPQLEVGVEIGHQGAYVFGSTLLAPGGLPVGSSGRALLLLSGGIDSPVAAWLAAKRGLELDSIYFHSPPFVGERTRDKVVTLGRILARWQAMRTVAVVPFTDVQKRLRDAGPAELAVVLYRRMMLRIADIWAERRGAGALVTGENLGQVASQTLDNMRVIEAASRNLVLRPLVTYDKVETTALARRIGTYETSVLPFEDCCSLFVPRHPATRARLQEVERAEAKLDLAALALAAADATELLPIVSGGSDPGGLPPGDTRAIFPSCSRGSSSSS